MSKKVYVCKECGNVFRPELSKHIDDNIQVYCEMCGTPFILGGVNFQYTGFNRKDFAKAPAIKTTIKKKGSLGALINFFNAIAYLPILIFGIVVFALIPSTILSNLSEWGPILVSRGFLVAASLSIALYDILHILPNVKKANYESIVLDAFCFGILGCVIYGTGVIILIKGFFIIIKVALDKKNTKNKLYSFGQNVNASLNNFSSLAGVIIIFMLIWSFFDNGIVYAGNFFDTITIDQIVMDFPFVAQVIVFFGMIFVACIFLILDISMYDKLRKKSKFTFGDSVKVFIIGVCSTVVFAVGIFILLKGILIFFLFVGKPIEIPREKYDSYEKSTLPSSEYSDTPPAEQKEVLNSLQGITTTQLPSQIPQGLVVEPRRKVENAEIYPPENIIKPNPALERGEVRKTPKPVISPEKREEIIELKLHESLLPVRNDNDKKIVKEYFKKIFNIISKDLREKINDLNISKSEKKEILSELAFLSKEEQLRYIGAIVNLYQTIPQLLIERIKKIPKIKPEHFAKIINQLKYMDSDERLEYIQFLEKNA